MYDFNELMNLVLLEECEELELCEETEDTEDTSIEAWEYYHDPDYDGEDIYSNFGFHIEEDEDMGDDEEYFDIESPEMDLDIPDDYPYYEYPMSDDDIPY